MILFRIIDSRNSSAQLAAVMLRIKIIVLLIFAIIAATACFNSKPTRYSIADSKTYESSLFRQHCSICHGPEGEGKTLDDGKIVPSLRQGELKKITEGDVYRQIAEGGNGMTPFRDVLTERELKLLTDFVVGDLRTGQNHLR